MRDHSWDERRDLAVHLLARVSLVIVLAVLGALFVGSAATSQASESTVGSTGSTTHTVRDQARPAGLLLGAVVIGGGLAVVAHVVLPDHALTRLRQRAGELLKTEIDYAATVVRAFVHELDHPADAMSAAG